MQGDVLGLEHRGGAGFFPPVVEVAGDFGLAIDHDGIAGMLVQVHAIHAPVMGDKEAVMDLALAVHPLAAARLAHQGGEAVFQHAGADAAEHVVPGVPLQHHGLDALEVEQLGEQQARGAAADDAYPDFHAPPFMTVSPAATVPVSF